MDRCFVCFIFIFFIQDGTDNEIGVLQRSLHHHFTLACLSLEIYEEKTWDGFSPELESTIKINEHRSGGIIVTPSYFI